MILVFIYINFFLYILFFTLFRISLYLASLASLNKEEKKKKDKGRLVGQELDITEPAPVGDILGCGQELCNGLRLAVVIDFAFAH